MTALPTHLRWFWRLYGPAVALVLLALALPGVGPAIELRLAPVRGPDQRVEVIERTPSRLCWAWTFTKLRDVASDNEDVFLVVNGQPGGVTMTYEMETGRPWGLTRYAKPPRAEPYTLHECAPLPPYVGAVDKVVVRQVAFYPGFASLWRLDVPFPDVVSPGMRVD